MPTMQSQIENIKSLLERSETLADEEEQQLRKQVSDLHQKLKRKAMDKDATGWLRGVVQIIGDNDHGAWKRRHMVQEFVERYRRHGDSSASPPVDP